MAGAGGRPIPLWSSRSWVSEAPRPQFQRTRTVAWSAVRDRICKDGSWNRHYIGIDVSKDRLDVHVRPSDEAFAVARDGVGLAALVERLGAARSVFGGAGSHRRVRADGGGGSGGRQEHRWLSSIPGKSATLRAPPASLPRPMRSMPKSSPASPRQVRPEPRPVPDEQARALGELVARRRQIIEMMTAERNRQAVN